MRKIFLLLLIVVSCLGCERDDICDPATATTPQLVIEFYNSANPTAKKIVTNLQVKAPDIETSILGTNGVDKIKIPLNITTDTTTFEFIENGLDTDATNDNTDVLQFTYTRSDVYVSRACGFKKVFALTNTNSNLITPDTNNWIDSIIISQPNIVTENEIHIKIYF